MFGILLLSACRRAGELLPADVLRRATAAGNQLQSAEYDAHVQFSAATSSVQGQGVVDLRGTIAHGGQEMAFSINGKGSFLRDGVDTGLTLIADVVSETQDLYLRVHTLTLDPPAALPSSLQTMIDTWWRIPQDAGSPIPVAVTPDPEFLRAQAAVVTVTEDHGLERLGDRDVYHYSVAIDPDRLVALGKTIAEQHGRPFDSTVVRAEVTQYDARGELWIDAETFVLHRLSWVIVSRNDPSSLQITFGVDLRNHNAAAAITVPPTSEILRRDSLLQLLPFPLPASSASSSKH